MKSFKLLNSNASDWFMYERLIANSPIESVKDFKELLSNFVAGDLKTFEIIQHEFSEAELMQTLKHIVDYSLRLEDLFQTGQIPRLCKSLRRIEFTRAQTLCLLCHMFLCTFKRGSENVYWVTFENWLTDGRVCAIAYLTGLVHYFQQAFAFVDSKPEFMREKIVFNRFESDRGTVLTALDADNKPLSHVELKLDGKIEEDQELIGVDFANQDIGFGVSGTQEEILFAASPEMCVGMLFCDTLNDLEAIIIQGAQRVVNFDGYGLSVRFNGLVSFETKSWSQRQVIAIDAVDFSDDYENAFRNQLLQANLERELIKAHAGFSHVRGTIVTGHWGCGAFQGNKEIKSLIQLVAASLSSNDLIFYCHGGNQFRDDFDEFLQMLSTKQINLKQLWLEMTKLHLGINDQHVFAFLKARIKNNY